MEYRKLFESLDVNEDGRLDVKELAQALKERGMVGDEAKVKYGANKRGEIRKFPRKKLKEITATTTTLHY